MWRISQVTHEACYSFPSAHQQSGKHCFWNFWYSKAHLVDRKPVDLWTDCHTNCQIFREMIRPSFACVSEHIKGTEDKPDTQPAQIWLRGGCTYSEQCSVQWGRSEGKEGVLRVLYKMWIMKGWKFQKLDRFWQPFLPFYFFPLKKKSLRDNSVLRADGGGGRL